MDIPLPVIATYALAAIFGIVGLVQLSGIRAVRTAYRRLGYSAHAYRLIGTMELLAGCFLAVPALRPWGVAVAASVNFIAVVMLLKNRRYFLAAPGLIVMTALPFALLT